MCNDLVNIPADHAQAWTTSVLHAAGVSQEHAAIIAHTLVLADLRGVDSHGIQRLPQYLKQIASGGINLNPTLAFVQKSPVMALLDARGAFGFVASKLAVDRGISMAETFGVGIVGVKNSGHFGMAAAHCLQAMEKGMAAMCFTNSAPAMPAWGSKEKLWGTNPMAVGFPGSEKGGFLLDMSTSIVAKSKVLRAARRGESIPDDWMLDASGKPTTDAQEALKGVILPTGGAKGAGLAGMIDIFSGLLTGSFFGGAVRSILAEPDKAPGTGHWFMIFRPEMFLDSKEEYLQRMDTLVEKIRGSESAHGVEQIFVPGERPTRVQREREESGIPMRRGEIDVLNEAAVDLGLHDRLG